MDYVLTLHSDGILITKELYMKKIVRLTESDLSRIVGRVIRENADPLQSLIGKTAVFKLTDDEVDDKGSIGFNLGELIIGI